MYCQYQKLLIHWQSDIYHSTGITVIHLQMKHSVKHFSTATVHEWNDEIYLPTMVALEGAASYHITDSTKESHQHSPLREMCQQNKKKQ